ncbi:MAG: peptidase domain protein [Gemmatimonadetes bacterium]|nr:peptidase domain protein [Gemmatimonadota bacterium]
MSRRFALPLAALALLAAAPGARAQGPQKDPPAPGPLRPFAMPPIRSFALPNGLKVMVVERHAVPIVTARLVVDAGAAREPSNQAGLAALTGALLSEGTRTLTGTQFQERLDALGAQFGTGASYDFASVSVTALKARFPEALALAMTTVTEPAFAQADFDRVRTRSVAQYLQGQSSVEGLSATAFRRAVYEAASPYARPAGGTRTTLTALTRDDVAQWHRTSYAPGSSTLLIVGDVSLAEARTAATRALGGWTAVAPAAAPAPAGTRAVPGTRVVLVDRPGSVQSGIYVGQGGVGYADPDYLPMVGLSQVLGGGFRARINMNLRERHGWTYGAFTSLAPARGTGTFAISSSVRTNVTDSAVAEAVKEYRRIAAEPVPAQELRDGLNNLVGSFPSTVQTVQGLLGRMQTVLLYGLPLDYYATYRERLAALTPADISGIAHKRLTPDAVTIVVAGDLSKIEPGIRALNLGAVEVWSPEGEKVR